MSSRRRPPIPDRQHVGVTTYDAKDPDTAFPPIEPLRPPAGAPNVLIILLDDAGFGSSPAFGGPCQTPNFERLAANGLKYNRFHTTALCSPTRQALLTGATTTPSAWRDHRNRHVRAGLQLDPAQHRAPLAETLKLNGYTTAQFGKCHEVPVWETSPMGPFDHWPAAAASSTSTASSAVRRTSTYPALYEGTTPVEPPTTPEEGYHFTEDMTDKAIDWVRQQKALMPDKPFFVYYAPGRDACAASRAEGVVGQVQGQVRPGLGQAARGDLRAPEEAGRDSGGRGADRAARRRSRRGTTCPTTSSRCSRARWRCTPASWSTPTITSGG